jgi:hypothetical protein
MKWLVRFALWATALAWPCHLLAAGYQAWLIRAVGFVLGYHIQPPANTAPDLAASNVLGIFVAMCLASTNAPRLVRGRVLVVGLGVMALVELMTGLASVAAMLEQGAHGPWSFAASRFFDALLALPRFATAPAVWLLLLGQYELSHLPCGTRVRRPA